MPTLERDAASHVGTHIRDEIDFLGMTPERFAREAGIDFDTLTAILDGFETLSDADAEAIADYFGTSVELWLALRGD